MEKLLRDRRRSGRPRPSHASLLGSLGALLLVLWPAAAAAQQAPESSAAEVEALVRAFQAEHAVPGIVAGIADQAGERVLPFGFASLQDSVRVDADTRFEIGSVTKLFTALLLAEMAERGEIDLDDTLGEHLGDAVSAPLRGIRLHQLATHTSGLPRLPSNLEPADLTDPYVDYGADRLHAFLATYEPEHAPGERYEYSNVGAGLLGELLARRAASSLGDLLRERVLEPLGMHASYLPADDAADPRLAVGYGEAGEAPYWRFDALAGAGAMRASAADMLRFLRMQIEPPATPLGAAIEVAREPHAEGPNNLRLGLAWHAVTLPGEVPLYFHNGGTGGFRAFVGLAPTRGVGVIVLANRDAPLEAIDELGVRLMLNALEGASAER